jgi:hypothetical protein
VNEETIKSTTLSTALVDDDEFKEVILEPFSVAYQSNKTHYKCAYESSWTATWYPIGVDNLSPCMTNNSLPINLKFKAKSSKL